MYKFNNLFRNFNYFLKFYLTIFLAVSFIWFDLLKFCLLKFANLSASPKITINLNLLTKKLNFTKIRTSKLI